jgi:hypothetical protein
MQQIGAPPHFDKQVTAFSRPLDWPRWSSRLTSEIITSFVFGLLSLGSYEIPVYAVKSNRRAELLNRIMDPVFTSKNDDESVMRAVTSVTRRARLCTDNQGRHFESRI